MMASAAHLANIEQHVIDTSIVGFVANGMHA